MDCMGGAVHGGSGGGVSLFASEADADRDGEVFRCVSEAPPRGPMACALEHAQTRARKREQQVRQCSRHVRLGVRRSLAELEAARARLPEDDEEYRQAAARFRAVARFAVPLILLTAQADADDGLLQDGEGAPPKADAEALGALLGARGDAKDEAAPASAASGGDPDDDERLLASFLSSVRQESDGGGAGPAAQGDGEFEHVLAPSMTASGRPWDSVASYQATLEGCCLLETALAETRAKLAALGREHRATAAAHARLREACQNVTALQDENEALRNALELARERVVLLERGRSDAEGRCSESEVRRKRAEARAAEYKRIIMQSDWNAFFSKNTLMLLVHVLVGGSMLLASWWRRMPVWVTGRGGRPGLLGGGGGGRRRRIVQVK